MRHHTINPCVSRSEWRDAMVLENGESSQGGSENIQLQGERLHRKVRWIVSHWNLVNETLWVGRNGERDVLNKRDTPSLQQKVIGTVAYGGVAAIAAVMISRLNITPQEMMVKLSLWMCLSGYGVLWGSWHGAHYIKLLLPLWVGFSSAWLSIPVSSYLCLTMGLLVWIRSGDSWAESGFLLRLGQDILFSYGGLALLHQLMPSTKAVLPIDIFVFFVLQGIFFLFTRESGER